MGKLTYKQDRYEYYFNNEKIKDIGSYHVDHFLMSEAGGNCESWIEIMEGKVDDYEMMGNMTYLRKEGNKVYLGWWVVHDDPYPDPNEYQTTPEQLIPALRTWVMLRDMQVETIIVEVNDERISIYSGDEH